MGPISSEPSPYGRSCNKLVSEGAVYGQSQCAKRIRRARNIWGQLTGSSTYVQSRGSRRHPTDCSLAHASGYDFADSGPNIRTRVDACGLCVTHHSPV